jgi:hypothetical protein
MASRVPLFEAGRASYFQIALRLTLARTLVWALMIGGWLSLEALGRQVLPLWLGGMVPIAIWLAGCVAMIRLMRDLRISGLAWRSVLWASGLATAVMWQWSLNGGGPWAVCFAALGWSVLPAAASRAVDRIGAALSSRLSPVLPAVIGTALAWALAGDPLAPPSSMPAFWLVAAAGTLALLSSRMSGSGGRAGLLDCALPPDEVPWREPSAWPAFCARWTMLPMMAMLAAMAQWCGGAFGLTPAQSVGLHLSAMLLPPLVLLLSGRSLNGPVWITFALALGLCLFGILPGSRGLMAISLCQSVAWGLAWFGSTSRTPGEPERGRSHWAVALVPAAAALALGSAIDDFGPSALIAVQVTLGLTACAGAVAGWLATRVEPSPDRPIRRASRRSDSPAQARRVYRRVP